MNELHQCAMKAQRDRQTFDTRIVIHHYGTDAGVWRGAHGQGGRRQRVWCMRMTRMGRGSRRGACA
eukprot:352327-Chlamydomonas_euryale.AAC.6